MSTVATATKPSFTILDWTGVVVVGLVAAFLLTFPLTIAPVWRSMLDDFGGSLPRITALVLGAWLMPILGTASAALAVVGVVKRNRARLATTRALVVLGFVLGAAALVVCVRGLYAPAPLAADALKTE